MKKVRLLMMSLLVLLLGGTLIACSTRSPNANFTKSEVYLSVGEEVNLDDYLKINSADSSKVVVKVENPSIVRVEKSKLSALMTGSTFIYVTYGGNALDKMKVIVKDSFLAPSVFSVNSNGELTTEDGRLTWNAISAFFAYDTEPTVASEYRVRGTLRAISPEDGSVSDEVNIDTVVNTNAFVPTQYGSYTLTVQTVGKGHFDSSLESEEVTFFYGAMPQIRAENLSWNTNGTLTWSSVQGASYKVVMDNVILGELQTSTTFDLHTYMDGADAGEHGVGVVAFDNENRKLPTTSEILSIRKLEDPRVEYVYTQEDGGRFVVYADETVSSFDITARQGTNTFTSSIENPEESNVISFDFAPSGTLMFTVVANPVSGNYYKSFGVTTRNIYKMPDVEVEGLGEVSSSEGNSTRFELRTQSSTLFDSRLNISFEGGETQQIEGYTPGLTTKNVVLDFTEAGVYTFSVTQIPNAASYEYNDREYVVLNSTKSSTLSVTKLADFGTVSHSYVSGNSTLTFGVVEGAENYNVSVLDGDVYRRIAVGLYNLDKTNGIVTFNGKIEELFKEYQVDGKVIFKISAHTANDNLALTSFIIKELTELSAPTAIPREDNTDFTYTWNAVDNASSYNVVVYEIDRATYNAGLTDIDVSGLTPTTAATQETSYTFENEGYYLVKVFSVSGDEDNFISSTESLDQLVCVSKQLTLGTVSFGFNGEKYYLLVENLANVDSYSITVEDVTTSNAVSSDSTSTYLLTQDFSDTTQSYDITVVAKANDNVLYLDSDAYTLTVKKLPEITRSDLTIGEWSVTANASYVMQTKTQSLSILACENAKGVKLWETANESNRAGGPEASSATYNIAGKTNVDLSFKYFGSTKNGELFVIENNEVFLDSEVSTLNFSRLATLTDLQYQNGKLLFNNVGTSLTDGYDLTIFCKDANGTISNIVVTIIHDGKVTAKYNNESVQLASTNDFIENDVNAISLDLTSVVELVASTSNVTIANVYNQGVEYGFAIYSIPLSDSASEVLQSQYATIHGDASANIIKIEKMVAPVISYAIEGENIVFEWEAVSTRTEVASSTTYQMFVNGERFGGQMSGTTTQSYSLSEFDLSTYYAFSLVAENPYYMESNTSNTIRIWKLAPINTLRLLSSETNAVQLEYQLSSTESDFVDYVKVNNTQNTTGKIAIGSLTSVTLQVIGLKDLVSGDVTTSYIDSTAKTWNLQNMSNLAPSDETIRYESNVLSWERFADGTGLTELSYVLMFDDGTNVATYTTTSIQESLTADNTTFYNTIAGLNEGEITISLYARLSTYDVIASGTIYYAERMQLADGNFGVNYYAYAGTRTIKKLTTPVIETVDFSYTGLENATNPNIVLTFSGNYDNSARFAIYLNGELIENVNLTKNAGVYTYTLTPSDFNNVIGFGEEATISICALSSTDIPSSMGNVKVRRAALISSVGFEQNASKYNHNLVVSFSEGAKEYTLGGVIAKIVYTANGGTEQTEYRQIPVANVSDSITYDLSSFIASNLAVGGTIKVSVITDSYADNNSKVYFLSCSEYKNSIEYEVLKAVAQADITTLAGGFTIDKNVNSEATTYVVVHNADTYNVQYDSNEDRFYFPYRTTWENSQYNFTVYAAEDGFVQSAPVVIAVTLNRIDPISGVSITRDASDLSAVTMQWTNVSGANGYILRLYDAEDGRVLYETDALTGNAHTTIDLFGENFKKVVQYGEIDGVTSDMDVKIGLSAIGADDSHNDSLEYVFNATIKGNSLRVQDIAVNEYGIVTFSSVANQKYLYRFVDGLGNEIANSNWTQVVADSEQTKIDASFLSSQIVAGAKFNLELIVMGNATASTSDADFILDSLSFTTVSKDLTFEMGSRIDSIGIDIEVEDGLAVVLTKNAVDKLYFGLTADAIVTGEVAEIVPEYVSDIDVTAIYRIGGAELLDLINENFENIPYGSVDLYFWAYRQTETSDSNYVNYAPTVYNLTYVASCGYEKTEKYVKTDGAAYDTDYASSLVFFTKDSGYVLAGLFVRITDEEENTKTIYTTDLTCDYYSDSTKYILNMTKLFEQDSDLVEESGNYSVDFALLQIDTLGNIRISNWMSETESKLSFTKLPKVESLRLSAGMLSWTTSADIDLSYYVYLATTVNAGKIGPTYTRYETSTRYFLATDFIGEDGEFYIGVQGVSDVANVIGSTMVFIEKDETPVPVVKNMIKVPLELDGGKLFFDWDQNGDFVQTLLSVTTQTTQAEAKDIVLATYSSPFTFTMKDLTDGTTTIRFRFTSENGSARVSKNVDIQARDLMLSIFETPFGSDIYTSLDKLYSLLNEKESRDIVTNFKKWMESTGSFGIANHKTIFDDYFEKIQQGRYSLEYCLVGGSTTLNSYWHQFENQNGQNVIYVGAETEVKGIQVTTSTSALNHYQVLIKKSSIYNASYEAEGTDNYVVKIYNDVGEATVFSLTRGVDSYSLTLLDDNTYSVTVYETDSTGVVTANGDYLMFYLNHNGGDSVLGQYEEDIEKGTYGMQIYTVGNQFTTSSKSEYFRVTFFGMGEDFGMQNGMFTWTTQDGRNATVVYKKDGIARETVEVLDGSKGMLIFNLEDGGSGLYEYIEFVTVGEVSGNWIAVDSEMYRLEGSTKLESPYITNTLGYVAINDLANKTTLENSYSASSLFTYKIYNDVSTEDTYITITDTRADGEKASTPLFHETGVTGFADNDIDYAYRETEVDASMFYVSSVGSTAEFAYVNEAGDDYYIKTVYGLETDGTPASDPLAISSDFARIKAMMMDQTGEVKILNGKLAWDEVVGRDSLTLNTRTTVVYKIVVELYKKSNSEYGTEDTILQETKTFYTTKTEFEFPEIEGAEDIPYIKVSVRAMGLSVVSTLPETIDGVVPTEGVNFVSLVEGGYAYDNAKYENSGDTYILLSEGTLLKNIERTAKIDDNSLEVVDGYLRWTYTLEDETGSDYDLFEEYKFSVYTESGKEATGNCEVVNITGKTFTILFKEDAGQIPEGVHTITVYATKKSAVGNIIRSYGTRLANVVKLKAIEKSDITINSTADQEVEIFDLGNYFANYPTLNVVITSDYDGFSNKNFNSVANQFYILSDSSAAVPSDAQEKTLGRYIVITESSPVTLTMQATTDGEGGTSGYHYLYSDVNDEIILQRVAWNGTIVQNQTTQEISWTYDGEYSLQSKTNAVEVTLEGDEYVEGEETVLPTGTMYVVIEEVANDAYIAVGADEDEKYYKISKSAVVGPTYIATVTYGDAGITRTYTTSRTHIMPDIIDSNISISVRMKLGPANIQSNAIYAQDLKYDLFESGQGTTLNPYKIANETQFKNLQYRMKKDVDWTTYLQEDGVLSQTVNEENIYHFELSNDVTVSAFDGILFSETFAGVLDGANYTIKYTANDTASLGEGVSISHLSAANEDFRIGAALFRNLSSEAIVQNLNLDATFKKVGDPISQNTLVAGLVITNNGQISKVSMTSFASDLVGRRAGDFVNMLYSGIASINTGSGTILNCSNVADMIINTTGEPQRDCIAGIVSVNEASITQCTIGVPLTNGDPSSGRVFMVTGDGNSVRAVIAGVATMNLTNSTIENCLNYTKMTVVDTGFYDEGEEARDWIAYLAGIVVNSDAGGTLQDNDNANTFYSTQTAEDLGLEDGKLFQAEICFD